MKTELAESIKQSFAMHANPSFRFLKGEQLEKEVAFDVMLIQGCLEAMDKIPHIVEGEWVNNGGVYKQVAKVLDASSELVALQLGGGNHYLTKYGGDYSGSLDYPIDVKLKLTEEKKLGNAWIFHMGSAGAQCGVYFKVPFRVWEVVL